MTGRSPPTSCPLKRAMSLIINNDTVQGGKGTSTAYVHLSKHRKIERFSTFNFSLTLIIASFARRNSESQQVSQVAARDHFHDSFFFLRSSPLSFSLSFFSLLPSLSFPLPSFNARDNASVIPIPRR